MLKLIIADLKVNITGDINQFFMDRCKAYESDFKENADITIHCEYFNNIEKPMGKIISSTEQNATYYYDTNGNFGYYFTYPDTGKIYLSVLINKNHASVKIYDHDNNPNLDFSYPVLNTTDKAFRYPLLNYNGLVIHASSIVYENYGIAFSAPSGTGKSTQTALWLENYSAKIINDDSPIIRFENNSSYIYGSPWAGSTGINTNLKVPLKAIIFLEQAPANTIEKIMPEVAFKKIAKEINTPRENVYLLKTLTLLDTLLKNTDCYILKCTPDKRASDLVKSTIF